MQRRSLWMPSLLLLVHRVLCLMMVLPACRDVSKVSNTLPQLLRGIQINGLLELNKSLRDETCQQQCQTLWEANTTCDSQENIANAKYAMCPQNSKAHFQQDKRSLTYNGYISTFLNIGTAN